MGILQTAFAGQPNGRACGFEGGHPLGDQAGNDAGKDIAGARSRKPRKTGFALHRERNLVERFFGNLKQYRALATRYDKLANTFLAAVALVCVLFWLN